MLVLALPIIWKGIRVILPVLSVYSGRETDYQEYRAGIIGQSDIIFVIVISISGGITSPCGLLLSGDE